MELPPELVVAAVAFAGIGYFIHLIWSGDQD